MGIATSKGLAKWMKFKAEQNADDRRMRMQIQYDTLRQGWAESSQRRQEKEALLRTNPEQYAAMYPYEKRTKSLMPYIKFQQEQKDREFAQKSNTERVRVQMAKADDDRNFYLSTMNSAATAAAAGNAEISNQIVENAKRINPEAFKQAAQPGREFPFVGAGQGVIENAPPGLPATQPGTFIGALPSPTGAPDAPPAKPKGYTETVGGKKLRYDAVNFDKRTGQWSWKITDVTGAATKPERKKTFSEANKIWAETKETIARSHGFKNVASAERRTNATGYPAYKKAVDGAWRQFEHKYAFDPKPEIEITRAEWRKNRGGLIKKHKMSQSEIKELDKEYRK